MVLAAADRGRRARLPLRWFFLAVVLGGVAVVALGVRAGWIDPSFLQAGTTSRTEVEADPTVILRALTEEADLVVAERNLAPATVEATNTVTVHVPLVGSQDVPSALAGEHEVAEVGPGQVELRVDLGELRTSDLEVVDGTVRVHAPLPRIAQVDPGPVRTVDESSGLLTRGAEVFTGDSQSVQQQDLSDAGRARMLDGARQDAELFELGRQSLERTLRRLLVTLPGVDRVQVDFPTVEEACATHDAPEFCAANRGAEVVEGQPQ
ncbi:MAG: DUF4230 domain-containing protein [Acidimicrobiales bacterium]|nr:DUF4230 domain-containing protein [Acidimicrobiales bacterium]MCB1016328.1 DUF4230 domain-containing protein [Acidimicrobiales bacterium]